MNHNSQFNMDGKNEDLFFLSNGHISPVFYSILARTGYFPIDELKTFRKIDSRLQGHPTTHEGLPGVRVASGSLGQGLSVAIGAALTKKLNKDNSIIYTLHGDGELQEGQIWEAAMFASAHKVDNIISTIDYNGRQIDGDVDDVIPLGNIEDKWKAFGWDVILADGHSKKSLVKAFKKIKFSSKPKIIIADTVKGKGVSFSEGHGAWHHKIPNKEELKLIEKELGKSNL